MSEPTREEIEAALDLMQGRTHMYPNYVLTLANAARSHLRSLSAEASGAAELAEGQRSGQAGTGRKPSRSPAGRDCVAGPEVDRGGLRQDSPSPPAQEEEAAGITDAMLDAAEGEYNSDHSDDPDDRKMLRAILERVCGPLLAENARLKEDLEASRNHVEEADELNTQHWTLWRSAEAAVSRLRSALEPFAKLQIPTKPQGNAGAYSIRHDDIARARAALASKEPQG